MPTIDLGPCECCSSCCFDQIRSFDFTFHAEPTGPAPPEIENDPNYCLERCDVTFTGSVSISAWDPALFNPWPTPDYYGDTGMGYVDTGFSTTCSSPNVQWGGFARVGFYCNGPGPYVRVETSWIYANTQYCPNGSAGPMGGYNNTINGGMSFILYHAGRDNEQLAWPCDVLGVEQTLEQYEYAPAIYNFDGHMARKTLTFTWNTLP